MEMRPIDAVQVLSDINWHHKPTPVSEFESGFNQGFNQAMWIITHAPTLTPPNEWVSVEDELPKLPDRDWCAVMVNTAQKGNPKSRPMIYERAIVRGKRVERWKYYWDRIADELPDYWMPLPAPPYRRPPEGEET